MRQINIFGCGYLGSRLAKAHLAAGDRVLGLVRSPESVAALRTQGIEAQLLDMDDADSSAWPEAILEVGLSYYLIPPPKSGTIDSRSQRLLTRLQGPGRVILASTTGVYGDCGGDWVDETRPPQPTEPRALRRLSAEQQWQDWARAKAAELIILRLPGFYGPDRLPRKRLEQGLPVLVEASSPWSNRIHIQDLTNACLAAMDLGRAGEIYNLSDSHPGTMTDYFNQVADHLGLPRPPQITLDAVPEQLSAGMQGYLRESRRIDNSKMLRELGVELLYPTLAQGLSAC
jgi:nucleoside-diphosphate-sugar epimerase